MYELKYAAISAATQERIIARYEKKLKKFGENCHAFIKSLIKAFEGKGDQRDEVEAEEKQTLLFYIYGKLL